MVDWSFPSGDRGMDKISAMRGLLLAMAGLRIAKGRNFQSNGNAIGEALDP